MSCIVLLLCVALPRLSDGDVERLPVEQSQQAEAGTDEKLWFDNWQQELTRSMDYTARQLDSFFALEGSDAYRDARAEGRVSLGWEPRTRDLSEMDLRFRIRVKLPALEDRVDLVLSDNEDNDNQNTIKAARDPVARNRDNTTIALRYRASDNARMSYRIGTGRRGQIYAKARFQDMAPLSDTVALFYDAETYYYNRDGLGAEVGATFQYLSHDDHVFRFNNRYYYRDEHEDWLWRHELQYLQPLTSHSAAIYTLFTEGLTKPSNELSEVYTSFRYRMNPTRDWLFYEIEPFVLWLKEEDFKPSYGLALRVEVYYGKGA
ncbi:hypothetical protein Q4520_20780 [Alteromonas sp. 1_MG-2023]|uniref:hypothetical protein n=1 Tax=Alteromonas sp. 1_MG-2023 TaxID=3062669 RepID=UPI0026E2E55B|nr:hypothetical protein [Alteromonas sp. 1_MG-2023]MDO6477864.1 hypothetical protein [Alteromonas sp. 1_MG-2023]